MPSEDSVNTDAQPPQDVLSQWQETWVRMHRIIDQLDDRFQVTPKILQLRAYTLQHPYQTLGALAAAAFCSIPVLGFLIFAFWSAIFTVCGFLVLEGALLTIGLGVLCMSLTIFGSITLFLGGLGVLTYTVITNGRVIFSSACTHVESQVKYYLPELYHRFNETPLKNDALPADQNVCPGKMAAEQTETPASDADANTMRKRPLHQPTVGGSIQTLNSGLQNGIESDVQDYEFTFLPKGQSIDHPAGDQANIKYQDLTSYVTAMKSNKQHIMDEFGDVPEMHSGGRN